MKSTRFSHLVIKTAAFLLAVFSIGCSSSEKKGPLAVKKILPNSLTEISGLTAMGPDIWAVTDKPKARVFRLDTAGQLLQTVNVSNAQATDVEAVTSDDQFLYLGDVGDNIGDRIERQIIKIKANTIAAGAEVAVPGEIIAFTFPNEEIAESKKQNNFDCESIMSFRDSLYLFTKDREDKETKLYALPKTAGRFVARYISSFNSEGLVTDAAHSFDNKEVALTGYRKGHLYPFIFLFTNFTGNDFFSGDHQKIELANKPWDWQMEGITYSNRNIVYFSCEGTKQVPATFYGIKRDDIMKLVKKKVQKQETTADEDEGVEGNKKDDESEL